MKLAYLVQCHKNPGQINRMIKALSSCDSEFMTDFYIHVDKKSNISTEITRANNVFLIEDSKRVDVRWGQISLPDAVFVLFRTALDSGKLYDYFWHISCQDYPIKSNQQIFAFLQQNNGKVFMRGWGAENELYRSFLKRNQIWYPQWMVHPHNFFRILHGVYVLLTGGRDHTFAFFKRKRPRAISYLTGGEDGYYFGSAWFTITRSCAEYILDYISQHPEFYAFFKNTVVPEECLFPTIVFHSPFRKDVMDYLCYVDWSEHKRNPKILTVEDYDTLIRSKYLIARKFDDTMDVQILERLDRNNGVLNRSIE